MVNRYEPCYMDKTMDLEQDGEYVRYEDYKKVVEALRKCNPHISKTYNYSDTCVFCGKTMGHCEMHTNDCEYIQLTESEGLI